MLTLVALPSVVPTPFQDDPGFAHLSALVHVACLPMCCQPSPAHPPAGVTGWRPLFLVTTSLPPLPMLRAATEPAHGWAPHLIPKSRCSGPMWLLHQLHPLPSPVSPAMLLFPALLLPCYPLLAELVPLGFGFQLSLGVGKLASIPCGGASAAV